MKQLYHLKLTSAVHPISDHRLSFLPAALLALSAALSPADKEVLAYLISSTVGNTPKAPHKHKSEHDSHVFNCDCFSCYTRYWERWDNSENRQLIHEIIDAFEEGVANNRKGKNKRERKKRRGRVVAESTTAELEDPETQSLEESDSRNGGESVADDVAEDEKGSMRKFVSFIGEKFWGGWK